MVADHFSDPMARVEEPALILLQSNSLPAAPLQPIVVSVTLHIPQKVTELGPRCRTVLPSIDQEPF
jgi:hypothetical protein